MKKITTILLVILTLSIINIRDSIAQGIPQDAGISQILNITAITDLSTIPLDVRVKNYGTSSITSVDILYDINGLANTLIYNGSIAVGDSVDISLGNILLNQGINNICVKTILLGDTNYLNDEICINTYKQAIVNIAYNDDFEGADLWMPDTIPNQWERGIPAMTNINTAHSPVNVWAIGLDTNYDNNSTEYLYTPKFNTIGVDSATLNFWHFYETEVHDGGHIEYRRNNNSWIALGYAYDIRAVNWYNNFYGGIFKWSSDTSSWVESSYFFDFTNGEFNNCDTIQFRFVFTSNTTTNNFDGWAIDDFSFELPPIANDIGVTAILSPANTVQTGDTLTVKVELSNFGTSDQSTFDIWYQIGNQAVITETYNQTGGLLANTTQLFTFDTISIADTTNFTICAGTTLANDNYNVNDDFCNSNIIVTPAAFDAGIISIETIQDNSGNPFAPIAAKALIKNFGINTLTSFNVEYTVDNGNSWTTEPWTGNLATNEIDTFIFNTTFNPPLGNISHICAITSLANDDYTVNDMLCNIITIDAINSSNNAIFKVSQSYPNPAYGNISINYTLPTNGDINFELRNTLGQVIYNTKQASFTGKNTIEVDANNLANGVYYYSVISDGQRITRKMIVNK